MIVAWWLAGASLSAGLALALFVSAVELVSIFRSRRNLARYPTIDDGIVASFAKKGDIHRQVAETTGNNRDDRH